MSVEHEYDAELVRVIDGDTVVLRVDLGFRVFVSLNFRVFGINAPELKGATRDAGLAAKAELERLLTLGPILVRSHKGQSFERWIGELFVYELVPGGVRTFPVADRMIASGHAVAFSA